MARRALGLVAVATVLMIGCGGDDEPTEEEAEAELCHQRADLDADLEAASEVDPSTVAVDQVADAIDEVRRRLDDLDEAGGVVAEARWADFKAAVDDFGEAVDDLGDQPVEGALTEIREAGAGVVEAAQAVFEEVDC